MKKRRMRLTALLLAALMICGLAIAEPTHEHQWSQWQTSADAPNQKFRACIICNVVETRRLESGAEPDKETREMEQGTGTPDGDPVTRVAKLGISLNGNFAEAQAGDVAQYHVLVRHGGGTASVQNA